MSDAPLVVASHSICPQCGSEIGPAHLACPLCHRLVHAQRLTQLAADAQAAAQRSQNAEALRLWREALDLLPPNSNQYAVIVRKIEALGRIAAPSAGSPSQPPSTGLRKLGAGGAAIGLLLWKLKFIVLFVATKAKLLLLGLTKAGTFFSMFLAFGVYWAAFGWPFALGLVLSIYIHEMGHVEALRRYGFKATAPMFIPGLGALIRLRQHPVNSREDARIGLAGPTWGLAAALAAYAIWLVSHRPIWGAIAHFGAWINLFNLLPIGSLDGGRGIRALSRGQAWALVLTIGATWFFAGEGLLLLLAVLAIAAALAKPPSIEGDPAMLGLFIFLVVVLSFLSRINIPTI